MAIQINGSTAIDNNRRGVFAKLNPGVYTTSQANSLSKLEGDVIYNSDEQVLQVWNGSQWRSLGGAARLVDLTGERRVWYAGGHFYASWLASGTVSIDGFGEIEVLIQAGGGGGGAGRHGGGGGAGGNVYRSVEVSPGTYNVTVGSAGSGMPPYPGYSGSNYSSPGTRGGNSSVFGITANGGGARNNFAPGGCGAGGSDHGGAGGTGNQGFPGGAGANAYSPTNVSETPFTGGGGGGIGAVGETPPGPSNVPGKGGKGKTVAEAAPGWEPTPSNGVPFGDGFGGGGSAGGAVRGQSTRPSIGYGAGAAPTNSGSSASAYSGSGGGGGRFIDGTNYGGGNGGSGFVVIRWPG